MIANSGFGWQTVKTGSGRCRLQADRFGGEPFAVGGSPFGHKQQLANTFRVGDANAKVAASYCTAWKNGTQCVRGTLCVRSVLSYATVK